MDMRPSAVLTRALARLGPNGEGWMQLHPMRLGSGPELSCALVAIRRCEGVPGSCQMARMYLNAAIGAVGASGFRVAAWNDAPERTFDDVRRAFVVAIGMAHADEQQAAPVAVEA